MIVRTDDGISEQEQMTVSEGFVIAEGYSSFGFKNSPFKRSLSVPLFYVFKINEGHPLVIYNNGGSVQVYPKRDFDAIHSETEKMRFPAEWSRDRIAYDLATFMLIPYDINDEDIGGWRKIDYLEGEGKFFGGSLLYVEHGMMVPRENQRASHVMPSSIPNYFYTWMIDGHRINSHDDEKHEWVDEGMIKIPVNAARNLTRKVDGLLTERFETEFLLKR